MIFKDDEDEDLFSLQDTEKKINSLEDASRYAYGLSVTRDKVKEIEEVANIEIQKWKEKIKQVEEWRDSQVSPLREKADYLAFVLSEYHKRVYEASSEKEQKKLKSIKLPYGVTLTSRVKTDLWVKSEHNEAYVDYCLRSGFYEAQPPKLKWGDVKKKLSIVDGKIVDENGEVLDFIDFKVERGFDVNE